MRRALSEPGRREAAAGKAVQDGRLVMQATISGRKLTSGIRLPGVLMLNQTI